MNSRYVFVYFILAFVSGCFPDSNAVSINSETEIDLDRAKKVEIWATRYYLYEATPSRANSAIPLRDMNDRTIGPRLVPKDWCNAAIEGSVRVSGKTYNYAGVKNPRQAKCRAHKESGRVRWAVSPFSFGVGSSNNALVPYRTLACDLGTVSNSKPWFNGGFPRFGQKIYIPQAKGTVLPDRSIHDGIFICGDVGGLIVGNHIDVFIGGAIGAEDAARSDPFNFVHSSSNKKVVAYVLP